MFLNEHRIEKTREEAAKTKLNIRIDSYSHSHSGMQISYRNFVTNPFKRFSSKSMFKDLIIKCTKITLLCQMTFGFATPSANDLPRQGGNLLLAFGGIRG